MIQTIRTHLPAGVLSNEDLAAVFVDWSAEKIFEKTGISERRVASADECASDLAVQAALRLDPLEREAVDWLLFCTQTPDYLLPTTACLLQERLGLPTTCAALDFNLGCSGYLYGLSLATALLESGQARRVLLATGDTYSRLIHPNDRSTRTIFGDAGSATLLDRTATSRLYAFVLGSDGRGAPELIFRGGGARLSACPDSDASAASGSDHLFMNGPEIFNFTLKAVPKLVDQVLAKAELSIEEVDLVVFHQANAYMLEHLRRKLRIPPEKFPLHFAHCGNTVSSTIPIVLEHLVDSGRLQRGTKILLAGFGVGFSWGGCILEW